MADEEAAEAERIMMEQLLEIERQNALIEQANMRSSQTAAPPQITDDEAEAAKEKAMMESLLKAAEEAEAAKVAAEAKMAAEREAARLEEEKRKQEEEAKAKQKQLEQEEEKKAVAEKEAAEKQQQQQEAALEKVSTGSSDVYGIGSYWEKAIDAQIQISASNEKYQNVYSCGRNVRLRNDLEKSKKGLQRKSRNE